ncbi:MAG: hypothetical protein ACREMA_00310 [Longimicrobiales bacterium]
MRTYLIVGRTLRSLVAIAALGLSGCDQAFMAEPAEKNEVAPVALSVTTVSAGGAAQAFDKADTTSVEVSSTNGVRLATKIAVRANGQSIPILLQVPLLKASENFTLTIELRRAGTALFRGSTPVSLRIGPIVKQLPVTLTPVAAALALPDSLPTLTAYGDSVLQRGATVFATLDTVAANQTIAWTSLDPAVISITGDVPVARTDGLARLVGRVGNLADTMAVRVFAIVTRIALTPDTTAGPIMLGFTRQFTAALFDRRNNTVTNRPLTWTSSNPAILGVDGIGVATGQALGSSLLTARSGNAAGNQLVQVRGLPPVARTDSANGVTSNTAIIHATVNSNRLATEVWLAYGTDSTVIGPLVTNVVPLPAGTSPVRQTTLLSALTQQTTYYVRVFARNQVGTTMGNRIAFTTPGPVIPPPQPPLIETGPAIYVTASSAKLTGSAGPGTQGMVVWFEWSHDPTFEFSSSTPEETIPDGPIDFYATVENLTSGITYYFRVRGRNASGLITTGATQSFRTLDAECNVVAGNPDSSCSPISAPVSVPRTDTRGKGIQHD